MITPVQPQTPGDVASHYDDLDFFYRDTWGRHVHHGCWETGLESPEEAAANLTRIAAGLLDLPGENAEVVDIGCGCGETPWHLATRHRVRVTGFTLSEAQKAEAENQTPLSPETPVPKFHLRDWLENDLPDASQDAALSIECISHVADKQSFFTEVHRTLKPGARLVLTCFLAKESATPWQRRHLLEPVCRDGRLAGIATMLEYRELIERSGLQLIEANDIGPRVAKTWTVIFRRLVRNVFTDRRYLAFLFRTMGTNPSLFLTIPRLILAYRLKCMGYLLLVAEKPAEP